VQQHYLIDPSRVLVAITLGGHLLVALAIALYVDSAPLMLGGIGLIVLLGWRESEYLRRQPPLELSVDPRGRSIVLEQCGQSHFYAKYKVYATRWFAILRLIDKPESRNLILHSERFQSTREYRHLRLALTGTESNNAA